MICICTIKYQINISKVDLGDKLCWLDWAKAQFPQCNSIIVHKIVYSEHTLINTLQTGQKVEESHS